MGRKKIVKLLELGFSHSKLTSPLKMKLMRSNFLFSDLISIASTIMGDDGAGMGDGGEASCSFFSMSMSSPSNSDSGNSLKYLKSAGSGNQPGQIFDTKSLTASNPRLLFKLSSMCIDSKSAGSQSGRNI